MDDEMFRAGGSEEATDDFLDDDGAWEDEDGSDFEKEAEEE